MNATQLIVLVLQLSIGLIVFSVALMARPGDLSFLFRRPSLLLRTILAMNIAMPFVAAILIRLFDLAPPVATALVLFALAPVPPIITGKQTKAGANVSYAIGLLATSALLSIVTVPGSVAIIGRLLGRELFVSPAAIAVVVLKTVLVPLLLGAIVNRLAPTFATRIAGPLTTIASIVLLLGVVLILATMWRPLVALLGDATLLAVVLFMVLGLVIGHLLGGPDHDDRTTLAISTASRHPGVAIAIAGAISDGQQTKVIAAAVLLCVLVSAIVTAPYVKWRKRGHEAPRPTTQVPLGSPAR
jgi:bile acid:Na+ symporter, BASS family